MLRNGADGKWKMMFHKLGQSPASLIILVNERVMSHLPPQVRLFARLL